MKKHPNKYIILGFWLSLDCFTSKQQNYVTVITNVIASYKVQTTLWTQLEHLKNFDDSEMSSSLRGKPGLESKKINFLKVISFD